MFFRKVILLLFLTGLVMAKGLAQIDNYQEAQKHKNQALTLLEEQKYDQAEQAILKSMLFASKTSNWMLEGDCMWLAATVYERQNLSNKSLQYLLRAVNVYEKNNASEKLAAIYAQIGFIYFNIEAYEKASDYFIKSKRVNSNQDAQKRTVTEKIGDCFYYRELHDSALVYYDILLDYSKKAKDTISILNGLQKLVSVHKKMNKYELALKKNLEIYELETKRKNPSGMSVAMNNAGYNYVYLNQYKKAFDAFKQSLENAEEAGFGDKQKAETYTNMGVCSQNTGNLTESILSLANALNIWKKQKNYVKQAKVQNLIALVYLEEKDLYNAATFSEESLETIKQTNDVVTLRDCYNTYSRILQAGDDYENALNYYKKYLAIRDSLLVEQRIKEQQLAQKVYELEKAEKEFKLKIVDEEVKDLAMKQLKLEKEKQEKDNELLRKQAELERSEKERAEQSLRIIQQQHEAYFKEQQIKNLEKEKEIKDLELKQKEAQEKERKKELQLLKSEKEKQTLLIEKQEEEKKTFLLIFTLVILSSTFVLYGFITSRRSNRKLARQQKQIVEKNEELNQQNEEISAQKDYLQKANDEINSHKRKIEIKNQEITDSIKYAHRIQSAVLPAIESYTETLSDYFIFYRPKDIVSGDFYWIKKIKHTTIFVVADCTGHGVPGAFMSMLGISFLNEIFSRDEIKTASEALDELRNKVKLALRQTGKSTEQKDGMDLTLMIIDNEKKQLQYAGAHNSMIMIRNSELTVIAADRMPIGIHFKEKPFTNHKIDIQKDDIFYAYTDGFEDQFGGESGRKFLSRNLKQLLLANHSFSMEVQKQILETTIDEWRSHIDEKGHKYPQVDDILILGMKVK